MISERALLVVSATALVLVIGAASFAIRHPSAVPEQLNVEDLPTCTTCGDPNEPAPESCVAAGGTVQFRSFSECVSEPNVHDVCGMGVPCFDQGNGTYCHDVKDPYCHCEADAQCPEGFYCQFDERSSDGKTFVPVLGSGECQKITGDTNSKEPMRSLLAPTL
ncbi:hypothetical protein EBS80_01300 [bacterium]|nr:hypothetical protein [bacterium]